MAIQVLLNAKKPKVGVKGTMVFTCGNSQFQASNVTYATGAKLAKAHYAREYQTNFLEIEFDGADL